MQIKNTAKLLHKHNILKYCREEKSISQNQHSFTIYVDFETMLKNIDSCDNNQEKYFYIFYIHLMDFQFQSNTDVMSQKIKKNFYRGSDCMSKFCERYCSRNF